MLDPNNIPLSNAYELIVNTHASFYLSGKAGTGKTTMIRNAMSKAGKNCVVVAPTGIAALSANGYTIHSFFGLPLDVIGPDVVGRPRAQYVHFIRSADTIIVDEVSMVRCDVMDALERTLRAVMENTEPFGGIQMIFVGDLFQLEPVVTEEDSMGLKKLYGDSRYHFFNARCMEYVNVPKIYLEKVYRQTDSNFVALLDKVRDGSVQDYELEEINERLIPTGNEDGLAITLTSFNADAVRINKMNLAVLPGPSKVYRARYEGDCSGLKSAVEDTLELKVGTRVVFTINESSDIKKRRWLNGTMAVVTALYDDSIDVRMDDGTGETVEVFTWHISNTVYDKSSGTSHEVVTGKISQLPLRLAWAITIHKSQSMTFDRVRIDLGQGAFSCGQVYVALSRARSIGGLYLVRPISRSSVLVSDEVLDYSKSVNDQSVIDLELQVSEMTDTLIEEMKYDEAAQVLIEASYVSALKGEMKYARMLMERFFRTVIDDRNIRIIIGDRCSDNELNAVYSFYFGDTKSAMNYLSSLTELSVDQYYLVMRCHENLGELDSALDILDDLLIDGWDCRQSNLPSSEFRKVLFYGARNYHKIGEVKAIQCLLDLSDDVYRYKGCLRIARSIIFDNSILWSRIREWCKTESKKPDFVKFYHNLLSNYEDGFNDVLTELCECYTKDSRFDPNYIHPFDKLFEQLFIYMEEKK